MKQLRIQTKKMNLAIYIPGLGQEDTVEKQRKIVKKWRNDNLDTIFLEPKWLDQSESFEAKLKRLIKIVEDIDHKKFKRITFFGTSAGGTLGLNLFNKFTDWENTYFVAVSGKIIGPELIGKTYSDPHPALIPSVNESVRIIADELKIDRKKRITSVVPLFDEVVNKKCMKIDGATHKRLWVLGHIPSIALSITLLKNKYI